MQVQVLARIKLGLKGFEFVIAFFNAALEEFLVRASLFKDGTEESLAKKVFY